MCRVSLISKNFLFSSFNCCWLPCAVVFTLSSSPLCLYPLARHWGQRCATSMCTRKYTQTHDFVLAPSLNSCPRCDNVAHRPFITVISTSPAFLLLLRPLLSILPSISIFRQRALTRAHPSPWSYITFIEGWDVVVVGEWGVTVLSQTPSQVGAEPAFCVSFFPHFPGVSESCFR